jgi:NADPH-dependent curcumin reductase CurA
LIRVDYVATVPGQRVWMSEKPSYTPPIEIGETMRAPGVGEVVVAGGGFSVGDKVFGLLGEEH